MNGEPFIKEPESVHGILYIIMCKINGKGYIGKKVLNSTGVKWQDYFGSSKKYLDPDIEKYGKGNFTREVIAFCYSGEELAEKEHMLLKEYDVLNNKDKWYNRSEGNEKFYSVAKGENHPQAKLNKDKV